MTQDARRYAPAVARNRDYIVAILREILPPQGLVLEVASGSGEHALAFAAALPQLTWQPSDPAAAARASIAAHAAGAAMTNLRAPLDLDVTAPDWPLDRADALLCINMIHISPWQATESLLAGAARVLAPGAPLFLYGPYKRDGQHTAPSNAAFDRSLRAENPDWGVRDLEAVSAQAADQGLALDRVIEMPANNLSVIFQKQ